MDNRTDTRRAARRKMMLEGPIVKTITIVAVPMMISMLIDSLYNMADAYFVSQLGKAATAAVGVNDSLMGMMRSLAMGFGIGASSYISRLMGAQREEEACKVGTTTVFTAMFILSAIALVAYIFMEPMVMLLGSTATSKQYSMDYAKYILLSAPFTAGGVCLSQLLRSEGSTQLSMVGMVSGCVINVALDPLFINVYGLGVAGAAMATSISKVISFSILLYPFLAKKTMIELKLRYFTPKWSIYQEVAKMGIPTFLRSSMMSVSSVITNNIAGSFGDSALAAVSVANKCTRFMGSAIMGFGQGFQPLAGYCWGAKKYSRTRRAFWTCSAMGATAAVLLGILMGIFAPNLVSVFNKTRDEEVLRIGTLMIRTQCLTLIPHVWVMVINGLFQALGKAVPAGLLGLSRQVICLIPSVIVLTMLFGVNGLACAQATADALSMVIAVPLLLHLLRQINGLEDGAELPAAKR